MNATQKYSWPEKPVILSIILMLLLISESQAQVLADFNSQRLSINQTGMLVLGTWAIGNIIISPIAARNAIGSEKYFHQMNMGWNAVNLAIAGFGYFTAMKTDPSSFSSWQTIQEQHKMETILLVNAALDVGYMLGGMYLIERSKNTMKHPDRLKGFGQSIILQGAFLFVFDLSLYSILHVNGAELPKILEGITLGAGTLNWQWRF